VIRNFGDVSAACEIMDGLRFVSSLKRLDLGSVEGGITTAAAAAIRLVRNYWPELSLMVTLCLLTTQSGVFSCCFGCVNCQTCKHFDDPAPEVMKQSSIQA
jgi:hypothetical protein